MLGEELHTWQSCCGATCLKVTSELLGENLYLGEAQKLLRPNSKGETSLEEICTTARKLGFYAHGMSVKKEKIAECTVPLIAHQPPRHFVVLLGLGKSKGVAIIDPPKRARLLRTDELNAQDYWNAVAVSKHPIDTSLVAIEHSKANKPESEVGANDEAIVFSDPVWDCGSMKPGSKRSHKFLFVNKMKEKVEIESVTVSCLCLKVVSHSNTVNPREEGFVEVAMDTKGILGYFSKSILVKAKHGSENRSFRPSIIGNVSLWGNLILQPPSLCLGDVPMGAIVRKEVAIRRFGFGKLGTVKIKASSPIMAGMSNMGEKKDDGKKTAFIEFIATGRPGPFEHDVYFTAGVEDNDPNATLEIYGRIVSPITKEPDEIYLGLIRPDTKVSRTVRICHALKHAMVIENVQIRPKLLDYELRAGDDYRSIWDLKLTGRSLLPKGFLNGEVTFTAIYDNGNEATIEIPFVGFVPGEN